MLDEVVDALYEANKAQTLNQIAARLPTAPAPIKVQMVLVKFKEVGIVGSFSQDGEEFWYLSEHFQRFWKQIKEADCAAADSEREVREGIHTEMEAE